MLKSVSKIKLYTAELSLAAFLNGAKTVDAVERNFEILGETTNQLPLDFQKKHSQI